MYMSFRIPNTLHRRLCVIGKENSIEVTKIIRYMINLTIKEYNTTGKFTVYPIYLRAKNHTVKIKVYDDDIAFIEKMRLKYEIKNSDILRSIIIKHLKGRFKFNIFGKPNEM